MFADRHAEFSQLVGKLSVLIGRQAQVLADFDEVEAVVHGLAIAVKKAS